MPPKNDQFTVYPDSTAVERLMEIYGEKRAGAVGRAAEEMAMLLADDNLRICGGPSAMFAARAIACWAMIERRVSAQLCELLDRREWNFLADVLNGTVEGDYYLGMYQHGASALALEVHDAQALNGTGDRWFGRELEQGSGQAAADELEQKILAMSWEQIVGVRTAVNFFWADAGPDGGRIDHTRDEWWTVAFRVRYYQEACRDTARKG